MRQLILDHRTAAGDIVVLTAAIRALHDTHPGLFETDYIGVHSRFSDGNNLFAGNPYITELYKGDPNVNQANCCAGIPYLMVEYGRGGRGVNGCGRPFHFLSAFVEDLSQMLGVYIELKEFRPDLYLSDEEREPWPGLPEKYIVIDAGTKRDMTTKGWSVHRYQQVVNTLKDRIAFVQVGSAVDLHPALENVVNLVGQTSLRDLIRVISRSSLVLTPISLPMHLCAGVPFPDEPNPLAPRTVAERHKYRTQVLLAQRAQGMRPPDIPEIPQRRNRPCVVLAGQREPRHWEQYPAHTHLGTEGHLVCGVLPGNGCWRNKTVRIENDTDTSVCFRAMQDEAGQWVPECLHRVSVEDVVRAIEVWL
jgi:hypothetical protein